MNDTEEIKRLFNDSSRTTKGVGSELSLKRRRNKFQKCGRELIDLINSLNPALVLDLGCGWNQYKEKITNLIGIDLVDHGADIVGDISNLEFDDNSADVCLCLGSINFGDNDTITGQIKEMYRVLKPGGIAIFRAYTTEVNDMKELPNDAYYDFTSKRVNEFTQLFNLEIVDGPLVVDRNVPEGTRWWDKRARTREGMKERGSKRLYWVWKK